MRRRKFLKISSTALAANILPINLFSTESSKSVVWEVEGSSNGLVNSLFARLGGLGEFIGKELSRATVLVKPNLCLPIVAQPGATSSFEIIKAVSDYLSSSGIKKIIIADHTLEQSGDFSKTQLNGLADKYPNVKIILANQQRLYHPVEVDGKVLKTTEVLKLLSKVDLIINLATAKHHSATDVSLSIKNLMGLIWDRTEFHTRLDLSQAIADLTLAIRPGINIIDAGQVLLNGGPVGPGQVIKDNRLFASLDMLALDTVVASRYNFGGKNLLAKAIPHLWASYQNGLGEIDIQKILIEKIEI